MAVEEVKPLPGPRRPASPVRKRKKPGGGFVPKKGPPAVRKQKRSPKR